jgi:hypothetical protein
MLYHDGTHCSDSICWFAGGRPAWVTGDLEEGYEDYTEYAVMVVTIQQLSLEPMPISSSTTGLGASTLSSPRLHQVPSFPSRLSVPRGG